VRHDAELCVEHSANAAQVDWYWTRDGSRGCSRLGSVTTSVVAAKRRSEGSPVPPCSWRRDRTYGARRLVGNDQSSPCPETVRRASSICEKGALVANETPLETAPGLGCGVTTAMCGDKLSFARAPSAIASLPQSANTVGDERLLRTRSAALENSRHKGTCDLGFPCWTVRAVLSSKTPRVSAQVVRSPSVRFPSRIPGYSDAIVRKMFLSEGGTAAPRLTENASPSAFPGAS